MWFKTVGGQQFVNSTLPYLMRTLEQLSNNIGRLSMAQEQKQRLRLGGDPEYLQKLLFDYGPDARVGDVARQEMDRLRAAAAVQVEESLTQMNKTFEGLEKSLDEDDQDQ